MSSSSGNGAGSSTGETSHQGVLATGTHSSSTSRHPATSIGIQSGGSNVTHSLPSWRASTWSVVLHQVASPGPRSTARSFTAIVPVHRDLLTWRVRPPLSEPSAFPHLEVVQVADVGDETVPSVCSHELIAAGTPVGLAVYALRDARRVGRSTSPRRVVPCPPACTRAGSPRAGRVMAVARIHLPRRCRSLRRGARRPNTVHGMTSGRSASAGRISSRMERASTAEAASKAARLSASL